MSEDYDDGWQRPSKYEMELRKMNLNIAPIKTEEPVNIEVELKDRILHVLKIYPKLSPSMLQIGIGSSIPPIMWMPILRKMIEDGTLREDFEMHPTPTGRHNTYTILSIAK